MVMDYYAYWNGGQIRDLFEALVSICSGSSYEGLLKTAVLAGFLVTLTGALLKWQGLASKVYLFAAVLFYSVMLVPKVDVAIHDERSADVYVVSNVPFGVGFFASATSKIGHFLTESFETAFSLPDAERFSKFGLVYPQRALNSLLAAGPVTPEGRALTDRVIADCIGPELLDHPDKAAELSHSGDIWATISADGWINPARSSVSSDGTVQRCDQALQSLDQHLNTVELDFLSKRLGTVLVPERIDPADVIRRTLPQSEALLLGVSRSLEQSLKHSVMLTALPRGMASIAAQAGANFLCYVTPAEHLRLPDENDVREGIVASKIAAHAADIALGLPGARDRDNAMAEARHKLDWPAQFALALDPEKAQRFYEQVPPTERHTCSMCGKMCAVRTTNMILEGKKVEFCSEKGSC